MLRRRVVAKELTLPLYTVHNLCCSLGMDDQHAGLDAPLLAKRETLYNQAMAANPSRGCRKVTRTSTPVSKTTLTPTDERHIERLYKCGA